MAMPATASVFISTSSPWRWPPQHEGLCSTRPMPQIDDPNQRNGQSVTLERSLDSLSLNQLSRRRYLAISLFSTALVGVDGFLGSKQANADEVQKEDDSKPGGLLDELRSLFDQNEKTKTGKILPKSYLKSAREVVKSLKESLQDESTKESNIRRSADSAKAAIRNYLQDWRGQKLVTSEESYEALENVFRILGQFYMKRGPRAVLPPDVKTQILENLNLADAAL